MIRRWSCLIDINSNFNNSFLLKKKHKIKIFKNSVNFKRFSIKRTKFKRKSLVKLKHQSNFLIYTNVLKLWTKDFVYNKNHIKHQFYKKIFLINFFFYNFNFFKNKNTNIAYNVNFIFSNLTKKKYHNLQNNFNFFKNCHISIGWSQKSPVTNQYLIPTHLYYENTFYEYTTNNLNLFNINDINNICLTLILKKLKEIKKILSILYFIKISNIKMLNNYVFKSIFIT